MPHSRSGNKHHDKGNREDQHGAAQIRLFKNQKADAGQDEKDRKKSGEETFYDILFSRQEVRDI